MKAIYKITNKINGKIYVGQSENPEKRFLQHCNKKENYTSLIWSAIKKYGKENFNFEILGWYNDFDEKEKFYISQFGSLVPNGYNILEGGQNPPKGVQKKVINQEIAIKIQQDLLNWNIPKKQIIKKYNVTQDIIRHINDGNSWSCSDLIYPLRPREEILNNIKALKVIELLQTTNLSQKEIGQKVGWNRSAITMINIGKNHFQENLNYPIRK